MRTDSIPAFQETRKGRLHPLAGHLFADDGMSRAAIFAGLTVIGFFNGISEKLMNSVAEQGLGQALLNTFDISVIVWAGLAGAIVVLLREAPQRASRADLWVAALVALAFIIPVPALSWVGLCGLSGWLYVSSPRDSSYRRGAGIIFALTIPLLWARLLFATLSEALLRIDSVLIAFVVGTRSHGNVVPFADGSGAIFIEPACSSFSNVSLAILCAAIFMNFYGEKWSPTKLLWIGLACAAVVAINVVRIGLIGFYPDQYDLIHGPIGASIAGWLTVAAILAVCFQGIARNAPLAR